MSCTHLDLQLRLGQAPLLHDLQCAGDHLPQRGDLLALILFVAAAQVVHHVIYITDVVVERIFLEPGHQVAVQEQGGGPASAAVAALAAAAALVLAVFAPAHDSCLLNVS